MKKAYLQPLFARFLSFKCCLNLSTSSASSPSNTLTPIAPTPILMTPIPLSATTPTTNPIFTWYFEYLDTDLKKFIDSHRKGANPRPLPPSLIQSFLFQLCKGVAHCHSHGVLHRDLKPQNLLLDQDKGILKIADLGIRPCFYCAS
ncbi:hypothetical protein OIU78_003018 [Salix suchowensis]|nr:hypothetical protein OIU78_003018 [Salix suchowensis]